MTRWTSLAVGTLGMVVLGALFWKATPPGPVPVAPSAHASGVPVASSAARFEMPPAPRSSDSAEHGDAGSAPAVADAGLVMGLPSGTPKAVRFGVVLVQYRGAEGAPANARTKDEAQRLARTLAQDAQSDFKSAVAKGDSGSMDDAGRMPRGVLEPTTEYALFTLKPGEVTEPIDTPRGFWILRRSE